MLYNLPVQLHFLSLLEATIIEEVETNVHFLYGVVFDDSIDKLECLKDLEEVLPVHIQSVGLVDVHDHDEVVWTLIQGKFLEDDVVVLPVVWQSFAFEPKGEEDMYETLHVKSVLKLL